MLVTIDFESSVYKGIAAITVNEVYAVMGSDVYWTNSKIFYFDSKKGSEMTDWKPYVRAVGYDPDKFERAFKETDVYLNFVAPDEYDEDWSVSNVSMIGVMIGDTETMVSIKYDGTDWNGWWTGRTTTMKVKTSELRSHYNG